MQERAERPVNIGDDSLPGPWNLVSPSAPKPGNPIKPGKLKSSAEFWHLQSKESFGQRDPDPGVELLLGDFGFMLYSDVFTKVNALKPVPCSCFPGTPVANATTA